MHTIIRQGKLLFALAVAATGAENLICAHVSQVVFANNRLAVPVLPYLPAIPILVYLVGIALLTAGVLIAIDVRPRSSAVLLGLFFIVCALSIYVPKAITRPLDLNVRTCIFEATALAAAALMLAGCRQREGDQLIEGNFAVDRAVDGIIAAAPYLFALSSVVFGVTHFLIARFIAGLVPAWMPGGMFWAYFTGAGFIVAGQHCDGSPRTLGCFLAGHDVLPLVPAPPRSEGRDSSTESRRVVERLHCARTVRRSVDLCLGRPEEAKSGLLIKAAP